MVGSKLPEAQRRSSILAAARTIALRDGLGAVSGRSVAQEAKLSSGLVYFYFGTKQQLLFGLLDDLVEEALDGVPAGFGEDLDADAALHAVLAQELTGLRQARDAVNLLFQFYFLRGDQLFRSVIADAFVRYGQSMDPVIERYASAHGLDPARLRELVVTLVEGAGVEIVRRPESFDADRLLSIVWLLPGLDRRRHPSVPAP